MTRGYGVAAAVSAGNAQVQPVPHGLRPRSPYDAQKSSPGGAGLP